MRRWFSRVLMVCVLVLPGLLAGLARAQSPLAIDFEQAFTPDFMRRDLPLFRTDLHLDDSQTPIMESLLGDYTEQFDKALAGVRKDLSGAQAALGAEDPATDQQREDLRDEIATLMEKMQNDLEHLPQGSSPDEVKKKYEMEVKGIQSRLEQLRPPALQPEQISRLFEEASTRLERWRAEKKQMREKFEGNAQAILHEHQREYWPPLQRKLLRQRTLGRSLLQGEGVDLLLVARDAHLSDQQVQSIAPALSDYEIRLDAALQARNDALESSERALFKAVQTNDRNQLRTLITRQTDKRIALRNVNDESAAAIAAALGGAESPDAPGRAFMQGYRQRAYPLVFRDTQTLRLLKAAKELPGVTPAQLESISKMQKAYEGELGPADEQVLATLRQHEPAQVTMREVDRLLPPGAAEPDAEHVRVQGMIQGAFAKRNEIGGKYDGDLQSLLGPEMYERLPRGAAVKPEGEAAGDDSDGG